jgi:hypothetical protein
MLPELSTQIPLALVLPSSNMGLLNATIAGLLFVGSR